MLLERHFTGTQWSPWAEMERMNRQVNRIFDGIDASRPGGFPHVNVAVSEENLIVSAELPGVDKDSLDISVKGNHIEIKGSRTDKKEKSEYRYHLRERESGDFSRTLRLPYRVNAEKVEAGFNNGVLEITLPRSEEDKPRKIAISRQLN